MNTIDTRISTSSPDKCPFLGVDKECTKNNNLPCKHQDYKGCIRYLTQIHQKTSPCKYTLADGICQHTKEACKSPSMHICGNYEPKFQQ